MTPTDAKSLFRNPPPLVFVEKRSASSRLRVRHRVAPAPNTDNIAPGFATPPRTAFPEREGATDNAWWFDIALLFFTMIP